MKRILTAGLLIFMACLLCGCSAIYAAFDSMTPDPLTRGTISGSAYSSTFAGITFTAPEGWVFASDEELAELMDMSTDALSDAGMEFSEDALKKQVLYDMQAKNPVSGANVLLLYENLALTGNTGISETKYLETTIKQLKDADIYQYTFGEIAETELCSYTWQMVQVDMTDYNVSQYYYVRKVDKYILCIIVSVPAGMDASAILDGFTTYEADSVDATQTV